MPELVRLDPPEELRLGLRHDDTLVETRGGAVTISLWVLRGAASKVALRCAPDGEEELHAMHVAEQRDGYERFTCTLSPRVRRLRYRFRLEGTGGAVHYSMAGLAPIDPIDAFDFTHFPDGGGPEWPIDSVLYQIFPDRFDDGDPHNNVRDGEWSLRGNKTRARPFGAPPLHWREGKNLDFYGGDLVGIERRLDHLQRLGATGLFLNPIWEASSNHRYDITDHGRVDPHLGGDEALASLRRALDQRSMKLVLDVVLNHTGSAHPWFGRDSAGPSGSNGAYRDANSPTRKFYQFDEWPTHYRGWLGHDTLPRLDLTERAVRDRLYGADDAFLRRFLRPPFRADGYRFDVANMIGRDGDVQVHRPLWQELRAALRAERPDVYLSGEHFFDPDKLLKGDGLDGVMAYQAFTFPLRTWILRRDRHGAESAFDAAALMAHLRGAWARVGFAAWRRSSLHVNTHDIPRLQTLAAPDLDGGRALALATAVQMALPGVPCLYYGDEVGLAGGADPDNRRCMEWDESRWNRGLYDHIRASIARRHASPVLRRGGLSDLGSRGDVLAFARILDGETQIVVASRARQPLEVMIPVEHLLGGRSPLHVSLDALSAVVLDLHTPSATASVA